MEPSKYSPFNKNSCFREHNPENNVTEQNKHHIYKNDEDDFECDREEEYKMMQAWFGKN